MQGFEKRNNLQIYLRIFSDGSNVVLDWDSDKEIAEFDTVAELENYLATTQYELAPSGRCYDPPRLPSKKTTHLPSTQGEQT